MLLLQHLQPQELDLLLVPRQAEVVQGGVALQRRLRRQLLFLQPEGRESRRTAQPRRPPRTHCARQAGPWDTGREDGWRRTARRTPSWRRARLHENQAPGRLPVPAARRGLGRHQVGWTSEPALNAAQGGRETALHTLELHTRTRTCGVQGEGRSPRSLSLLSCKVGVTDPALHEPRGTL